MGRVREGWLKRVPAIYPLPSPVLRTDYRLRSIAAGDRARCSLKGEGATTFSVVGLL